MQLIQCPGALEGDAGRFKDGRLSPAIYRGNAGPLKPIEAGAWLCSSRTLPLPVESGTESTLAKPDGAADMKCLRPKRIDSGKVGSVVLLAEVSAASGIALEATVPGDAPLRAPCCILCWSFESFTGVCAAIVAG